MNEVDFTEEELEMMKRCFYTDLVDCLRDCPYNDRRCNDFTVEHGDLPSTLYIQEVLNEQ